MEYQDQAESLFLTVLKTVQIRQIFNSQNYNPKTLEGFTISWIVGVFTMPWLYVASQFILCIWFCLSFNLMFFLLISQNTLDSVKRFGALQEKLWNSKKEICFTFPLVFYWDEFPIFVISCSGNFSIHFWRQYLSLFVSIAAIVSLLLTSDRKSFCWGTKMSIGSRESQNIAGFFFKMWNRLDFPVTGKWISKLLILETLFI